MHERALMSDLMRQIQAVAREASARRVSRVVVRLGSLTHFTPEHFRTHFADAAQGTVAEGAVVDVEVELDTASPLAGAVVLESLEVTSAPTTLLDPMP